MRLSIYIDNMRHDIDSTNPETLGRWIVEIFGRITNPTPATYYRVEAYPSWVWDSDNLDGRADWITDSRWLNQAGNPRTPRELITMLSEWLDNYEAEHVASSLPDARMDTRALCGLYYPPGRTRYHSRDCGS